MTEAASVSLTSDEQNTYAALLRSNRALSSQIELLILQSAPMQVIEHVDDKSRVMQATIALLQRQIIGHFSPDQQVAAAARSQVEDATPVLANEMGNLLGSRDTAELLLQTALSRIENARNLPIFDRGSHRS